MEYNNVLPNGLQQYNSVKLEKASIKMTSQITLSVVTKVLKRIFLTVLGSGGSFILPLILFIII